MAASIRDILGRASSYLTPSGTPAASAPGTPQNEPVDIHPDGIEASKFFPTVDPKIDGEDCLKDCEACPIEYPRSYTRIGIDEEDKLWGRVNRYDVHAVVATGRTDWLRDVEEEEGSIMQALARGIDDKSITMGRGLMISASNQPVPFDHFPHAAVPPVPTDEEIQKSLEGNGNGEGGEERPPTPPDTSVPTTVMLFPAWLNVSNVTPATTPALIQHLLNPSPTTSTPLSETKIPDITSLPAPLQAKEIPHKYIVMLCSHKRRDARCGISAPLLAKEFERQLRPLGLWRDLNDERPGGVGLYFINHVGGHKYSANVLIYRKEDGMGVWLARVTPKHVEGIVKWTILEGKVQKPEMVRGGWLRCEGKVSW